jgi:branched-chain amino acid transport system substrate-binding protein
MNKKSNPGVTRRKFLKDTATVAGLAAMSSLVPVVPARLAMAAQSKVKVGILLPYSGTYAFLGERITQGLKLAVAEEGGLLGGREIEWVQVDSQAKPPKAIENTNKLVLGEKVDFLVGPVHSGVAMAMAKVVREEGTITIVPNAGADQLTGSLCAPNIFRTSFTNWQPAYPCGDVALQDGHKTVVTMAWNYGAGKQSLAGFTESFTRGGGKVIKKILTPFPKVEFQAYLTEIASLKPDALFVFYSGGGAVKFVKDFAAAGLKNSIALYGTFLTEGTLKAQGAAAEGVRTTLHYADNLDNPANKAFRAAFRKTANRDADVYAVQGYDTGKLLIHGMNAVGGDTGARSEIIKAMEAMEFNSPRGKWKFSPAHNPVQDFYLREVRNGENVVLGLAAKALADPATECGM